MIVFNPNIMKESEEPFCDICIQEHVQNIAEKLVKEEDEKQKKYLKLEEISLDIKQNEKFKENIIEAQNKKINELQDILTQHNSLLSQIVTQLNNPS